MKSSSKTFTPRVSPFRSLGGKIGAAVSAVTFALTAASLPLHAQDDAQIRAKTQPQIDAIQHDQESRTPAQKKLDSQLLYAARIAATGVAVSGAPALRSGAKPEADGRYKVRITADVSENLLGTIRSLGGDVLSSFPKYRAIYALLPLANLETLAARPDVQFIGRPAQRINNGGAHKVTTANPAPFKIKEFSDASPVRTAEVDTAVNDPEGDATHGAKTVRTQYAVNGTGVKVGVISDSIDDDSNSYAKAKTAGYVPQNLVVLPNEAGTGEAEGLAMCEIVHRIAPGSGIYFATAGDTEENMAQDIETMQADGCKIICDDISFNDENPFQDGVIAKAVVNVTGKGSLYFSCAVNNGNLDSGTSSCWEGDFVSTNQNGFLDFNAGGTGGAKQQNQVITGNTSVTVFLHWAEPDGGATSQYNLIEYDPSGNVVQDANSSVSASGSPLQELDGVLAGDFVAVQLASGSAKFLHLNIIDQNTTFKYATAGHTAGHNACDALYSYTTAATPAAASGGNTPDGPYPNLFTSANQVEDFSCDGLRRMFFKPDGTAYTPGNFSSTGGKVFKKPDFTAADGVTTSVPAIGGNAPFYGTSAATPHAAALAALALSSNTALTQAQLSAALLGGAVAITKPGPMNRDAGAGILLAAKIFSSLPSNGVPVISSAKTAAGKVGTAFSYQIAASNQPTSYGVQGLPGGLTVNASTGVVSGTPKFSGSFSLTLNAYNNAGKGSQTLTLTVAATVPVITSAATASGTVGTDFSYQIIASNDATSYGVQGLPGGLTIDSSTGLVSGNPKFAGTFTLTLNAYNSAGKGSKTLTLTVSGAP